MSDWSSKTAEEIFDDLAPVVEELNEAHARGDAERVEEIGEAARRISKGAVTFRLWSLQRVARVFGLSVSLVIDEDNPKESRWPTLITVRWIGWGRRRRRRADVRGRSGASGFVPTEAQTAAYLRCKTAADDAWHEAAQLEDWS